MAELPYGSWQSPISASDVAGGTLDLTFCATVAVPDGVEVWWLEGRPDSEGRYALMACKPGGSPREVLGPEWNVRSRIMEYGARAWQRVVVNGQGGTVFSFWDDQRLYLLRDGTATPTPLTSAPTDDVTHMYGDPALGPDASVLVVRETQRDGEVSRSLVMVPLDGSASDDDARIVVVNDEHHFYGNPRLSPDGRRVSYIAWDHPQMPWDGTVAAVVDVTGDLPASEHVIAGSTTESVLQPEWADAESLYLVSDRSGWWNVYLVSVADGRARHLLDIDEEFAGPLWELGCTSYAVLDDSRLAVAHGRGHERLSVLSVKDGSLTPAGPEWSWDPYVTATDGVVASVVYSDTVPLSIGLVDLSQAKPTSAVLQTSFSGLPDVGYLPGAEVHTFTGVGGRDIHAFVYPPANKDYQAPDGELPPYVVHVHGGPTAHSTPRLSMEKAFFTSRGIGVIDVNYGGSTGYGRAYRNRLLGQWGVIDVEDSVAAAVGLADAGVADRARLGIRGGSAGGWTTVAALVQTDTFGAGVAYFPVTDLLPFAEDTHDFESRYLDALIGPLPESRELYVERSPLTHLDNLRTPILLLQGDDDKVVPPSQPQAVNDALKGTGIPHAYLVFAGEQHGFRKAESRIAALEAELSFLGQVFGFEPPGVATLPLEH